MNPDEPSGHMVESDLDEISSLLEEQCWIECKPGALLCICACCSCLFSNDKWIKLGEIDKM